MRGAGSSSRTTIAVKVGAPTAPPPTAPTPLRSPPIIFLDIDGVLNRTVKNTHIRLDADLVARLRRLCERTGAVIVLSTFWREFAGYIEYILRRHGVAAPVVGRTPGQAGTPSLAHEKPFASRAAEIEAYLAAQASGRPSEPPPRFVILDDRPDAGASDALRRHFVRTDPAVGLTDADVDAAVGIVLGAPRRSPSSPTRRSSRCSPRSRRARRRLCSPSLVCRAWRDVARSELAWAPACARARAAARRRPRRVRRAAAAARPRRARLRRRGRVHFGDRRREGRAEASGAEDGEDARRLVGLLEWRVLRGARQARVLVGDGRVDRRRDARRVHHRPSHAPQARDAHPPPARRLPLLRRLEGARRLRRRPPRLEGVGAAVWHGLARRGAARLRARSREMVPRRHPRLHAPRAAARRDFRRGGARRRRRRRHRRAALVVVRAHRRRRARGGGGGDRAASFGAALAGGLARRRGRGRRRLARLARSARRHGRGALVRRGRRAFSESGYSSAGGPFGYASAGAYNAATDTDGDVGD